MSQPFIGEIRAFGFHFAPYQWAFCNGQLMSIAQNQALFAVIGTTYGGDGQTTFALPNLQDRAPMHWGNGPGLTPRQIGEVLGSSSVTLSQLQMPAHSHQFIAATPGDPATQWEPAPDPTAQLSSANPGQAYTNNVSPTVAFSDKAIGISGGSQPHNNIEPILTLNFCMALYGIFPSRN